jgi:hypothetical protein
MIITNLKGGLGNQMFQYACGYALSKDYGSKNRVDISYFSSIPSNHTKRIFELSLFNISSQIATEAEIIKTRGKRNQVTQLFDVMSAKAYTIFTDLYPIKKYLGIRDLYLNGYFQSEKFFVKYRENILKEFSLTKEQKTNEYNMVSNKIRTDNNSISMHIRRGDYIEDLKTAKHHGVLGIDYYKRALSILNVKNPNIYVFSDDIDWVKKNFTFLPKNTYFVSKHKFNSAQEIILMSLCKHNIIANSSFSWWGAWLNQNKKKIVIAPKKWTQSMLYINRSIIPNNWHRT